MSSEPTREELYAAYAQYDTSQTSARELRTALKAANSIRDRRIRNEALEEAARLIDRFEHRVTAASIRALKDKTDE